MYNIVCADKKPRFLCVNDPPRYDITLGKYVTELHNLAIAIRQSFAKNNGTKDDLKTTILR